MEKKKELQETKEKVFKSVVNQSFMEDTKLFMLPLDTASSAANYMLVNFYNNLNILRILEFTILDYLEVPRNQQASYITPETSLIPKEEKLLNSISESIIDDSKILFSQIQNSPHSQKVFSYNLEKPFCSQKFHKKNFYKKKRE